MKKSEKTEFKNLIKDLQNQINNLQKQINKQKTHNKPKHNIIVSLFKKLFKPRVREKNPAFAMWKDEGENW